MAPTLAGSLPTIFPVSPAKRNYAKAMSVPTTRKAYEAKIRNYVGWRRQKTEFGSGDRAAAFGLGLVYRSDRVEFPRRVIGRSSGLPTAPNRATAS
jgi:hypothetical protein